jgi:tRNA G18 (ribose-2'-O)-methylase SpoU
MSYEIFGNEMTELHPTSSTVRQARQDEPEGVPAPSALIEGKNAVLEALRAGKTLDKLFIQDGMRDNTVSQILAKVKAAEGKAAPKSKWQQRLEEAQKMQREMQKQQAQQNKKRR